MLPQWITTPVPVGRNQCGTSPRYSWRGGLQVYFSKPGPILRYNFEIVPTSPDRQEHAFPEWRREFRLNDQSGIIEFPTRHDPQICLWDVPLSGQVCIPMLQPLSDAFIAQGYRNSRPKFSIDFPREYGISVRT